jgi:hypothetical protein
MALEALLPGIQLNVNALPAAQYVSVPQWGMVHVHVSLGMMMVRSSAGMCCSWLPGAGGADQNLAQACPCFMGESYYFYVTLAGECGNVLCLPW